MIQIDDKIVSFDVFEKMFLCDLTQCKGICCVEGDAGAPLEKGEKEELEKAYNVIKETLPEVSRKLIEEKGVSYVDIEGDEVTQIVNGKECVFSFVDEDGVVKCAVEKAYREGKIKFRKPISCYLYPVRVDVYKDFEAVNVHKWRICKCAFECGEKANLPVYRFLKEPLIAKYGREWYDKLCVAAVEFEKAKKEWKRDIK